MANEINKITVGSTTYTLQDERVDSLGASDVGAAPSASGTYFVNGTQTASTNAWTGTLTGITPYDGLAIRYYLPYAGTSTGATLALNGGTAYPVYRLGTSTQITTHFGAGSVIAMTFRTSYNVAGTTKTNAWICEAFYDSNTNTQVRVYRQDSSSYNKDYPLIASRTVAADLGTVGTESSYESVYGLISDTAANIPTTNPYTGESKFKTVTATTFNGDLSGNATTATTADNATKLGGQAATYYAAASSVPTKTSQLTNDSGFKTTDNNTTYSLSKSGSTITLTGSDGSTTSVTDANSTYSVPVNATTSAVLPSACTSNGFYYVSSTTNSLTDKDGNPFLQYHTGSADFRILATAYSASWIQQIATDFRSEHVYIRRCENGTWKPWTKFVQTGAFSFSNGVLTITT